jgi:hypothetical protein
VSVSAEVERQVLTRAGGRCEYCRMHQSLQGATFHIEHIIPLARGGTSVSENLALACPSCNLHKSDRVSVFDPETQTEVSLFHPRLHRWGDHFRWAGQQVVGESPIGRAAIAALDFNHSRRIRIRLAEEAFGLFPPLQ